MKREELNLTEEMEQALEKDPDLLTGVVGFIEFEYDDKWESWDVFVTNGVEQRCIIAQELKTVQQVREAGYQYIQDVVARFIMLEDALVEKEDAVLKRHYKNGKR